MIDDEVKLHYDSLVKTVNSVKDFSSVLPENLLSDTILLNFVLYFVEPSFQGIDTLTSMNGISPSEQEKQNIYPHVISFIVYLKEKFSGS